MFVLAALVSVFLSQSSASPAIDVRALKICPRTTVAEIDLGKLKGELRQLAWSEDGATLYLQTGDGYPPQSQQLWHYTVPASGGTPTRIDAQPAWASAYWDLKQDRVAPGMPSLVIGVDQKQETMKMGMGGGVGALDRTGSPETSAGSAGGETGGSQKSNIVRLSLLGQVVGVWTNERVMPGTRLGWGPAGSGAIAFVEESGQLTLFDREKHLQAVPDVKAALLPAWSPDGRRLAFLEKISRKKFQLSIVNLER